MTYSVLSSYRIYSVSSSNPRSDWKRPIPRTAAAAAPRTTSAWDLAPALADPWTPYQTTILTTPVVAVIVVLLLVVIIPQ